MTSFSVAADGSGDFASVQAAVEAIPQDLPGRVVINIRPGLYREKVSITRPELSLCGQDAASTVIAWDDHAWKLHPDGRKYGTFESFTLFAGGDGFRAEGLTIANTAGPGNLVGQAVAAYVDADRVEFRHCRLLGCQDTLFTGPLPLKPIIGKSFGGPRDVEGRRYGRQYYRDCLIQGDVDFIFGSATAVFDHCEIVSNERGEPVNGWITAASTPPESVFGYVFLDCRLTGLAHRHSVYLGRPWREHAKTAFVRCWLGPHIRPEGWHNWDKPAAEHSTRYAEADSTGPGAASAGRVAWSHRLGTAEAEGYTVAGVLGGSDAWDPSRA